MVAIKDMEMPTCCASCPFDVLSKCLLTRQLIKGGCLVNGEDKRLDDCPLVEIEERKVGKWIDCGFIDKSFRKYKCSNCSDFVYEKEYLIKHHKYCLHCGSRNDKE